MSTPLTPDQEFSMRTKDQVDAAIDCLKLAVSAVGTSPVPNLHEIVPLARDFYEFVATGKQPADAEVSR